MNSGGKGDSQGVQGDSQGNQGTSQELQGGTVTHPPLGTSEQYVPPPPPTSRVPSPPQRTPQGTGYPPQYPLGNPRGNPPPAAPPQNKIVMHPYHFADGKVMYFPTKVGDISQQNHFLRTCGVFFTSLFFDFITILEG